MEDEGGIGIVGGTELISEDFEHAWRFVPAFRKLRTIAIALPCIWVVTIPITLATSEPGGGVDAEALVRMGVPALALTVLFAWFLLTAPRGWAKRSLSDLGTGRITYRFDAEGFHYESRLRQARLAWGAIPQHIETPNCFLIFTGSQTLLLVPKRAFGETAVTELAQLLQQRVPTTVRRWSAAKPLLWILALIVFLSVWHYLNMTPAR